MTRKFDQAKSPKHVEAEAAGDARLILHELHVHQLELRLQNEELRRTQEELEAARARYFDLYDLAPVGYCTLSQEGQILEANLTTANLLGVARGALQNQPITRFILRDDQDVYYLHSRRLFETGERQEYDLRMLRGDGTAFAVHLITVGAHDAGHLLVCRVVLSQVSARKRDEPEKT